MKSLFATATACGAHLQAYKPDVVIVMNPVYVGEIQADLDRMGLLPELAPI